MGLVKTRNFSERNEPVRISYKLGGSMCYFCNNIRKVRNDNTLKRNYGSGSKLVIAEIYGALRFYGFGTYEDEDEIYRDCYVNFCPQCGRQLKSYVKYPVNKNKSGE